MDKKKIKEELYEIRNDLAYIKGMLNNIVGQIQELREDSSRRHQKMQIRKLYEHPWYKYKRDLIESESH